MAGKRAGRTKEAAAKTPKPGAKKKRAPKPPPAATAGNGAAPEAAPAKAAKRKQKAARTGPSGARKNSMRTVEGNFEQLVKSSRAAQVLVDQPVALISQAPRSGGTLLRNLFDGHPQCHVHPYEWHFGPRRRFEWPKLPLDATPEFWWTRLREEELARRFVNGVRRNPTKYSGADKPPRGDTYPLLLPPVLQQQLFFDSLEQLKEVRGDREIINAYMTSLFYGWLNNNSVDNGSKRWVVAFAPRLAWGPSRDSYFAAYPDGQLISILRSPPSWLASARGRQVKGAENNERLIAMWNRSATEMIEAKQGERGDRVTIVRFDDLVRDSEGVMRLLCEKLGIDFDDGLTEPTFNSRPIGANSSYATTQNQGGVINAPLTRHKKVLSDEDARQVEEECEPLHQQALELAERPAKAPAAAS